MGGSIGKTDSENREGFQENVWGEQGDALGGMYDQASDLYGDSGRYTDQIDQTAGSASDANAGLSEGMTGGMDNLLGGGSYGDTSDIRQQLLNSMNQGGSATGDMYNSIVGGSGNTYIDPMVDAMKSGAMENNAMLQSGNSMDATAMGQGGSSRHAMQNAMTNQQTNRDMLDQEAAMRGGAYDADLAMKMGIAGQADSNNQMNNDRLLQMLQGADSNTIAGMDQSSNVEGTNNSSMNPWMQAQQSAWNPMQNFASVLGGPTVLGSGSSSGSSKGANSAGGFWG